MAGATTTSRDPDARFLVSHPAHFIALGFGAGLAPRAPGTVGTVVSLLLYWALAQFLAPLAIAFAAIPLFFIGVWACDVTGRDLGASDHGAMVWDEIVAFLPLAAIASQSFWFQAGVFVVFRIFDIWKPYPIRLLERNIKGGMGVMIDDVVAAAYTYILFIIFIVFAVRVLGLQ
ncbi:MAG TPA: phosphatidylglycerophosphatase A [Usitatibacter sp.]|nr:phosphatidylglycerophosphatase A [Usitatibacter sp.]